MDATNSSLLEKTLSVPDFEKAFGEKLSAYVRQQIEQYSFRYTEIPDAEYQELIIKIVDTLLGTGLAQAGKHRLNEWEAGWQENLDSLKSSITATDAISPKYFDKHGAIRWRGRFIRPVSPKFEGNSLAIILDWLFDKYFRNAPAIYEFGCGTGHNLLQARAVNSQATLWGMDWATSSQKILEQMRLTGVDSNLYGHHFDYFTPDTAFKLVPGAMVCTVASLEQVGNQWQPFVDYLMANRPQLCVHVEPIAELLDPNVLVDNLSIKYFKKRNYLDGFLTHLRTLEQQSRIKIHRAQRTHIGSLFIEGDSVIVWEPLG